MRAGLHSKKKKSSFKSALLLGLIFGISLVVCQELAYQYRMQKRYEQYGPIVTSVPRSTASPVLGSVVTRPLEESAPPQEPDAEESGVPVGYSYSDDSNDVCIEIGNEEITIDFTALKSENGDFTGWFVIPGTDISYPVVQGTDNAFYLDHVFDGSYNTVGTLFADYRNMMLGDENTIIYGHNFHQFGAMFSKMVYYAHQDYYEEHPVMYYLTEECGYKIEVFSVYEASTFDPVFTLTFVGDKDYGVFLDHVMEMSVVKTVVRVTERDKVMTLSTCSNDYYDRRFVVVGKVSAFA